MSLFWINYQPRNKPQYPTKIHWSRYCACADVPNSDTRTHRCEVAALHSLVSAKCEFLIVFTPSVTHDARSTWFNVFTENAGTENWKKYAKLQRSRACKETGVSAPPPRPGIPRFPAYRLTACLWSVPSPQHALRSYPRISHWRAAKWGGRTHFPL